MPGKAIYRIKNWKDYNQSLINRGNITLWFDESVIKKWYSTSSNGQRGRDYIYADVAIECALSFRSMFGLALRQTQGFLEGLLKLLKLSLEVPNYSTLSRRTTKLEINLAPLPWNEPIHVVIDATGLKVYGEGEWKMRVHGKDKRRTWRKLHIAINRESHEIVAANLTAANVHDSMATTELLSQIDSVASVTGDKGYDNRNAYDPIAAKKARAIIPPRSGAALKTKNISWGDVERNRLIHENHFLGKKLWKTASGYSKRSLVETAIGRFKAIIGPQLRSRNLKNQKTEAKLGAKILNQMTHLGMPKSYKV